jgi:hypothetical protein
MFGNQTLLCQVALPVRSCAAALRCKNKSLVFLPPAPEANRIRTQCGVIISITLMILKQYLILNHLFRVSPGRQPS